MLVNILYKREAVGLPATADDKFDNVVTLPSQQVEEPIEYLERLWRAFNAVSGDEVVCFIGLRSMSEGDRVEIIDYQTEERKTYEADIVGWKEV